MRFNSQPVQSYRDLGLDHNQLLQRDRMYLCHNDISLVAFSTVYICIRTL